jgi:hypothetical protein
MRLVLPTPVSPKITMLSVSDSEEGSLSLCILIKVIKNQLIDYSK